MLDSYFSMEIVERMIHDLETNPRYNDKDIHQDSNYAITVRDNLALYIFYDAIYKYKVLIDDIYLFEEYIEQIDKLFRKMQDFDDIVLGINKLLCNFVSLVLDCHDLHSEDTKKQILSYIHKKYIEEGYYIHGFSTVYEELICQNGFVSGEYQNIYSDMITVDNIFRKHGIYNIFKKNFKNKSTYFTDDFVMACYYSSVSPGYFSNFITNNIFSKKISINDYIVPNFSVCYEELRRFLNVNLFSPSDTSFVLKTFERQWKCLNRVQKRVSILLIPRKLVKMESTKIEDYYHKGVDLYDAVDRILCPKSRNVLFNGSVPADKIQLLSFYFPFTRCSTVCERSKKVEEFEKDSFFSKVRKRQFMDAYGVASTFIVMGSLFITLGIIVSIIMILRGV